MKIIARTLGLAAFAGAATFFSACHKTETDPADPATYLELTNQVIFPSGGASVTSFAPASITGNAVLTPQALTLELAAPSGKIHMEVDRSKLIISPLEGFDWLGFYAWRCLDHPTDPVFVTYEFSTEGRTSSFPFTETTPQLSGNLTITAYDPKRRLISGRFEVTAPNQLNPSPRTITQFPLCSVQVYGKFDNLKVKQ